ncbi:MAG: hypothetical protein ACRDNL_28285 [Spirillospora sp.]
MWRRGQRTVAGRASGFLLKRVLAKLGLRDRVQAVVFAFDTGLVRLRG